MKEFLFARLSTRAPPVQLSKLPLFLKFFVFVSVHLCIHSTGALCVVLSGNPVLFATGAVFTFTGILQSPICPESMLVLSKDCLNNTNIFGAFDWLLGTPSKFLIYLCNCLFFIYRSRMLHHGRQSPRPFLDRTINVVARYDRFNSSWSHVDDSPRSAHSLLQLFFPRELFRPRHGFRVSSRKLEDRSIPSLSHGLVARYDTG